MGMHLNISDNHESHWYSPSNSGNVEITDATGENVYSSEPVHFFSNYNPLAVIMSWGGFVEKQTFENRSVYMYPDEVDRFAGPVQDVLSPNRYNQNQ